MESKNYSILCNHSRLTRVNKDFVRCLDCGQSMISQQKISTNKTSKDFVKENKSFNRNFDRNFGNKLEEIDEKTSQPLYQYYTDRQRINKIIVNRNAQFSGDPPKFEVDINGSKAYLGDEEIAKLLNDLRKI